MIPKNSLLAPDNNASEMRAFEATCAQLQGFEESLNAEFVDGFLCGLAAGPRQVPVGDWLPLLAGDTFERVFADPQSHAEAVAALQTRLSVLRAQLDPAALADSPDSMRLSPWLSEWTDEDRAQVRAEEGEGIEADEAALLHTGAMWASGFLAACEQLPELWQLPPEEEAQKLFAETLDQIRLLTLAEGDARWQAIVGSLYPDGLPPRDDVVALACMAVQDLRLLWVDFAPRPTTRRVESTPGRNDPCPCGSGKKFKRCHGAASAQA
ncbi:MAG TPA: UPF0149 family protein [Rubrivivax sp.]|nr:UPF0149 family protein [Rubrivivax sp.]